MAGNVDMDFAKKDQKGAMELTKFETSFRTRWKLHNAGYDIEKGLFRCIENFYKRE